MYACLCARMAPLMWVSNYTSMYVQEYLTVRRDLQYRTHSCVYTRFRTGLVVVVHYTHRLRCSSFLGLPYNRIPNPEGPYTLTMELGPKKTIPILVLGT